MLSSGFLSFILYQLCAQEVSLSWERIRHTIDQAATSHAILDAGVSPFPKIVFQCPHRILWGSCCPWTSPDLLHGQRTPSRGTSWGPSRGSGVNSSHEKNWLRFGGSDRFSSLPRLASSFSRTWVMGVSVTFYCRTLPTLFIWQNIIAELPPDGWAVPQKLAQKGLDVWRFQATHAWMAWGELVQNRSGQAYHGRKCGVSTNGIPRLPNFSINVVQLNFVFRET